MYYQDQTWLNKQSTFKICTKCTRPILTLQMTNLLLLIVFKLGLLLAKIKLDFLTKGLWVFQTKVSFQDSKQLLKTQWCSNKQKTSSFQTSHLSPKWIRHMESKIKMTLEITINNQHIPNSTIHSEDSNRHKFLVSVKLKLLHLISHNHLLDKELNSNK